MQNLSFNLASSWSSLKWKVRSSSCEFRVPSISLLPLEGILFSLVKCSVRLCTEPMTLPCRLKVKVTIEGYEFEPGISCSLHIFVNLGRI